MFSTDSDASVIPIHLVRESDLERWRNELPSAWQAWLEASRFRAERARLCLVPHADGRLAAVAWGLGRLAQNEPLDIWHCAGLAERLPPGDYRFATPLSDAEAVHCAQGWAYGNYRFTRYRDPGTPSEARLVLPASLDRARVARIHAALSRARDLINTAAADLTPAELADSVIELGAVYRARTTVVSGDELRGAGFPAIHAVGRASAVAPRLIDLTWGDPAAPRVTLVGKGVCFDSGGLDIKPAASMLLMKKDMGGAACAIALAELVMGEGLPVRLRLLVPAVENAIAGNAYRPGDVLATRKGLSVEVGNTDAEGRLILADALALADEERPEILVDLATLTGAARMALGPELPALFANDDPFAAGLLKHGSAEADPLWRLPLWSGYDDDLASRVADLSNVSSSTFAGAVIGALFLRRFVHAATCWAHIDLYAWNAKERPGRPVGAEPQAVRALFAYLRARYG